MPSWT